MSLSSRKAHKRYQTNHMLLVCTIFFIVPTPLEELYTQMGFFVQSILADRYIHRREFKLVSLESLSSVEHGIKKIFLMFVLTGRYRGLNFPENRVNSVDFIHLFSEF